MNWNNIFTTDWINNFWNGFGTMLQSLVGMTYNGSTGQMEYGMWVPMLLFGLAITVASWIFDAYLKTIDYPVGHPGLAGVIGVGSRGGRGLSGGVGVPHATSRYSADGDPDAPGSVAYYNAHHIDPGTREYDRQMGTHTYDPSLINDSNRIPALPENAAMVTADDHLFGSDKLEGGEL